MQRRKFLENSITSVAMASLPSFSFSSQKSNVVKFPWSLGIPPLFTIAYIDPRIASQQNQEALVAKYPLAIVSQSTKEPDLKWKDKVKSINPDIKMFGYQMVIEETTVPGPGHQRMRDLGDSCWVTYPTGYLPTVTLGKNKKRRIFDPRKSGWKDAFLEACELTLKSYPYDGLLLDQCTIFNLAVLPSTKNEMLNVLRDALLELRKRHPDKFFVANSSYFFEGGIGQLNENISRSLLKNSKPKAPKLLSDMPNQFDISDDLNNQKPKVIDCYQYLLKDDSSHLQVEQQMELAFKNNRFFGVAKTYQKIEWYDIFDDVISAYKNG